MTRRPAPRRALLLLLLLVLLGVLYVQVRDARQRWIPGNELVPEGYSPPVLRIGASAVVEGPVEIALHEPVDFDGFTREAVLALRSENVAKHPSLVSGYEPHRNVYGRIVDGMPWWGLVGQFRYGPGPRSTEGASEESRFVLNPFLLVGAELFGASRWGGFRWDEDAIAAAGVPDEELPLAVEPTSLTWWPDQSRAEVVYDATGLIEGVAPFVDEPPTLPLDGTYLYPQSARDLGFNFLHVDLAASEQVTQRDPNPSPFRIRSFIHRGGSCRYPGGCNNGSPHQTHVARIQIEALPARLVLRLWRKQPADAASAADMEFAIRFE